MYILLAQRKHIFIKKIFFWFKFESWLYVQVYLFIILYSYCIATNIIQYLLYLVWLVYECLYSLSYIWENGVSYCIKELCNLSLGIQGPFMEEGDIHILSHGRKVPQWWSPFLWLSIRFGPYCTVQPDPIYHSFCRNDQFVFITFSSKDTWT